MNLGGGGFTVPQENEFNFRSPWIPSTPGKPISTPSHSILLDGHGNRLVGGNWQQQQQQLVGYPIGYVQDIGNNNEKVQNFNPRRQLDMNVGLYNWDVGLPQKNKMINNIAGTYAQKFGNDSAQWNSTSPLAEILAMKNAAYVASGDSTATSGLHMGNRSQITNLQAQVNGNWKQQPGTTGMSLTHQNTGQLSGLWSNSRNLANVPQDGFPVPHRANNNLNSPPRTVIETTSSMTNSFPFAPVTPDQTKKSEKNWLSEVLNHYVEESLSQEGEKQDKLVMSTTDENIERHSDELLQNLVDSSSAANLLPIEETNKEGDQLIDLNKTPEQKATKRRKHRPKVVVEGKPKRTPRPVTTKNPTPQQNPTGKRKYVRKNAVKASEPKPADNTGETVDGMGETIDPTVGSAAKSCRRMLNFDLEKATGDNQGNLVSRPEEIQGNMSHNLNLNSQARELCSKIYSISRTESAAEMNQRDGSLLREQQMGAKCNLTYPRDQMKTNYLSMAMQHPAAASKGIESNNVNDIACNGKTQCAVAKQISQRNGYNPVNSHHIHAEGISEIFLQAKNTHDSLGRAGQQMLQSSPQSVLQNWSDMNELRGSKREYHCTIEKRQPNAALNTLLRPDIFQVDEFNESNTCRGFSETQKKRKIGNAANPNMTVEPSVTTIEDGSRQHKQGGGIDVNPYLFSSKINHGMLKAYIESSNAPRKTKNEVNNYIGDWYIPHVPAQHMFPKQHSSSELVSRMPSTVQKQSQGSTQGHCSVNEKRNSLLPLPWRAPISGRGKGAETVSQNTSAKMLTAGPTLLNFSCNPDKVPHEKEANHNQAFPCRTEGSSERQKYPIPIDEIISQLKGLTLDGTLNGIEGQKQNALVPYKGGGTIVPFEIKKRKPRPKVDLDPETERIWKLLMGKEGSEATDGPDKDKEKWWEEERKVFRGRADSFIARMHLVQGDRRFSQWKGSVVDSVIGVFLTQNVSDHLSSSAFMSLAAKFPLKSASDDKTCSRCEASIVVEEPEASILDPDDTLRQYEKLPSQLVYDERSITSQGSLGQRRGSLTTETETTTLLQAGNCRTDEEIISMQGFFRSFIDQVSGVQSFSSCNSEAKNPAAMSKANTNHVSTPRDLQMEKVAMFQEFHNCENGSPQAQESSKYGHQKPKDTEFSTQNQMFNTVDNLSGCFKSTYPVCSSNSSAQVPIVHSSNHWLYKTPDLCLESQVLGRDCTASWPSNASKITNAMDPNWSIQRVELDAESICNPPVQKNGLVRHQESPRVNPYALKSHHTVQQQSNFHPGPCRETDQYSCNSSQHDSTSATGPMVTAEIQASRQKNMQQDLNSPKLIQETVGEASSETGITTTKGRKGNMEGEKKKEFDWDSLRKQAQSHNKRERSKATMDSLDYEAVRCANVSKISNAIKERGMNNMLAERIQDFLNRLVRDHGSIDLEWLRDAPPDKAKDYLLSIRGLGLKSVECVRLLTLHHLAFPVDTNVGRIAVRLGWVPLQPLPESLQLHLLELYPVLESIQKYLWPRLCKLDQRTLYELHYQMITFGKVFCTKSKPNCNACPMRGECRHFASAFASARLALPGPEENSIMHSSIPVAAVGNPAVIINPMPLPPLENNPLGEAMSSTRNCEPIIEVPATPEPECTEISESDIEDAFYEDPDEIPTIRLNIEEFTQNLQNYMQENNLEVQEGDMSKALVALNPAAAASIPTPKLKNVSRLRTEHQVYELPDSHCLLKGLERREPDDPSPYLLAIWTPGETANSTQAPESQCESQDPSKLCNDMTCFSCNSIREANSQTVRGTILIPCRTAMRGSFPLNGTYFQVNEMFADHDSSLNPIDVPRAWIWNLPRRTVYFGTSVSTIFKGLSTEGIQYCFWRGFVCVRGFDQKTRAPRPLMARLHFPASKLAKSKNENKRHAGQDADLITGKGSANQDLSIQKA